ncbi:MAG: hypothetical protein ACKOS8_10980 [Gemmataceae bacterium]
MKKVATLLGGMAVLFFSGTPAKAQHPGFPNFGVTLSYTNFLPVFCQPEIPGYYRWGYGQHAAGKSGYNANGQPNCPPGYLWCGHGSNYCPGHQPYFPQTIYGQTYGLKGPIAGNPGGNGAATAPMGRAQGVGNFGAAYYGGQHGTSQVANPSAAPFYLSSR